MRRTLVCSLLVALPGLFFLTGCRKAESEVQNYPLGEKVYVGRLVYTAYETQWLTQIGQGLEAKVPEHRFFVVRASIANSGNQSLIVPPMTIEDDEGNSYSELTNGDGVPQWIGFLRQVKPAEALQGTVVFDAPPAHYKLMVSDENESHASAIDIPLTFNAETPELAVPGAENLPSAR